MYRTIMSHVRSGYSIRGRVNCGNTDQSAAVVSSEKAPRREQTTNWTTAADSSSCPANEFELFHILLVIQSSVKL